ncbi:hypothetical protein GCM10019017_20510 [Streptomyces showdoensis]
METPTARVPATIPQAQSVSRAAGIRPCTGGSRRTRNRAPGTKKAKTAQKRICRAVVWSER